MVFLTRRTHCASNAPYTPRHFRASCGPVPNLELVYPFLPDKESALGQVKLFQSGTGSFLAGKSKLLIPGTGGRVIITKQSQQHQGHRYVKKKKTKQKQNKLHRCKEAGLEDTNCLLALCNSVETQNKRIVFTCGKNLLFFSINYLTI